MSRSVSRYQEKSRRLHESLLSPSKRYRAASSCSSKRQSLCVHRDLHRPPAWLHNLPSSPFGGCNGSVKHCMGLSQGFPLRDSAPSVPSPFSVCFIIHVRHVFLQCKDVSHPPFACACYEPQTGHGFCCSHGPWFSFARVHSRHVFASSFITASSLSKTSFTLPSSRPVICLFDHSVTNPLTSICIGSQVSFSCGPRESGPANVPEPSPTPVLAAPAHWDSCCLQNRQFVINFPSFVFFFFARHAL